MEHPPRFIFHDLDFYWSGFELIKRPKSSKVRMFGSFKGRRWLGQADAGNTRDSRNYRFTPVVAQAPKVFIGPSVEGVDVEYIEIVSGKVSQRKPSFIR